MTTLLKSCLVLSLILNLCFGLWVAGVERAPQESDESSPSDPTPSSSPRPNPEGRINNWSELPSATHAQSFARDLRRLGCPERLIQHAVIAAIDREFATRQKRMSKLGAEHFWTSHDDRQALILERTVDLYTLSNERRAAIREATGKSWSVASSKRWGDVKSAAGRGIFHGFLTPDTADYASALHQSAKILKDDLDAIDKALPKETLREYRSGVYETFNEDLDAFLSPEQRDLMEVMSFELQLLDVNRPDKKFITDLNGNDRMDLLRILKPPDYMRGFVGLETTPPNERQAEIEAALLERFGEEMVEHYRKFKW